MIPSCTLSACRIHCPGPIHPFQYPLWRCEYPVWVRYVGGVTARSPIVRSNLCWVAMRSAASAASFPRCFNSSIKDAFVIGIQAACFIPRVNKSLTP